MPLDLSDYQTVEERLAQFWAKHPNGRVHTQAEMIDEKQVVFSARVWRDIGDTEAASTGFAQETVGQGMVNKTSWVENCETSAIGRALANLGFAPKGARASREEMAKTQRSSASAPAVRPAAVARPPVPTPAAPSADADEHKRAHEAKTTLDLRDPDRRLISAAQRKRLFTVARTTYKLSDDTIRTVVESLTGSRSTSDIQRWQLDQVMADLKMAGESIPS